MRHFLTGLLIMIWYATAMAQTHNVDWYVIGSGGGHAEGDSYCIDGTIGQPVVGEMISQNYILYSGFWVPIKELGGCDYIVGDINGSGAANGIDVTYGVSYLKGGNAPKDSCDCPPLAFPFYAAMDVNGSCSANGIDVTFFVAYLKGIQPALLYCPDCPPAGIIPIVPAIKPSEIRLPQNGKSDQMH